MRRYLAVAAFVVGVALAPTLRAQPIPAEVSPPDDTQAEPGAPATEAGSEPDVERPAADPPEPPPDPPEIPPDPPELARAKELHRQGLALLRANDVERALDYFQRSRAIYPSAPNITNEAICLDRLGRYDEALEAYELLVTEYAAGLDDEDRAALAPAMARLRERVAGLWISGNERGTVIVDGRERGKLPLRAPIRVLGGEHLVRIQAPGFQPWEQRVVTVARQTVNLDARLVPLVNVGVLRVESELPGEVVIDGAEVGHTPWEGPLSPGAHVIWLRAGDQGSAPQQIIVVAGQVALARPKLAPLGSELRLTTEPPSASVSIDGVMVGSGRWSGRLPEGDHEVLVSEPGYHAQRQPVRSLAGEPATSLELRLAVDPEHPRWPKPPEPGHLWVGGFVGYAGAHTMGAGAEAACPDACTDDPVVHGGMAAARVGYRFPMHLSLELGLGYALFGTALRRLYREDFAGGAERVSYELVDRPLVTGPFVAPSLSYRYPLRDWLALGGRAALGVMIASASSDVDGVTATTGKIVPVQVDERDVEHTVTLFVMPSLSADLTFGDLDVGLGLGVALFPLEGPALHNGPLRANAQPDPADPGAVGNAPASDAIDGERAWGPLALWVPHLQVGYAF